MVELVINLEVVGVFSNEAVAIKWASEKYPEKSFSVYPLGTMLQTDINE